MEYSTQETEVFTFLDDLQESGRTNMFGASPYVQAEFSELSEKESQNLVGKWMETYETRHPE